LQSKELIVSAQLRLQVDKLENQIKLKRGFVSQINKTKKKNEKSKIHFKRKKTFWLCFHTRGQKPVKYFSFFLKRPFITNKIFSKMFKLFFRQQSRTIDFSQIWAASILLLSWFHALNLKVFVCLLFGATDNDNKLPFCWSYKDDFESWIPNVIRFCVTLGYY